MKDQSKWTVSSLKREKRRLNRAHSKLARKVETMRKLHEDIANLRRQTGFLRESLVDLSSTSYNPPDKSFKDY